MTTKRLRPKWFKITEKLLYDYKTYDSAICNLEAELESIMPQVSCSFIKIGQETTRAPLGSQTEDWAIRRAESSRAKMLNALLQEKKRQREAVRRAREQLDENELKLVWLRYDKEKPHLEIWEALHMGKSNYFKFRSAVVLKIAKHIGLL